MVANNSELEKRLWGAADDLRANSKLRASEYSVPVLGLIFLRFAEYKFALAEAELAGQVHAVAALTKPTIRREV
jgi:type I restriction enzyme M protein